MSKQISTLKHWCSFFFAILWDYPIELYFYLFCYVHLIENAHMKYFFFHDLSVFGLSQQCGEKVLVFFLSCCKQNIIKQNIIFHLNHILTVMQFVHLSFFPQLALFCTLLQKHCDWRPEMETFESAGLAPFLQFYFYSHQMFFSILKLKYRQ